MRDPLTVAFEICYPWRAYPRRARTSPWHHGYRRPFVTIWHRDPERNGSDDSCGWSFPHPPAALVKHLISDLRFATRGGNFAYEVSEQQLAEGRVVWWLLWLERASYWDRGRGLCPREVAAALFHSGFPGLREDWRHADDPERLAGMIARGYGQLVRPWYRHPRWHVWHWRFQVHPAQEFKRWAFSRCAGCRRRFAWGETPHSLAFDHDGPRWFASERGVYHGACLPEQVPPPAPPMPAAGGVH